jgi:hypothetical protein
MDKNKNTRPKKIEKLLKNNADIIFTYHEIHKIISQDGVLISLDQTRIYMESLYKQGRVNSKIDWNKGIVYFYKNKIIK